MELKGYLFASMFMGSYMYKPRSSGLFWAPSTLTKLWLVLE